VLSSELLEVMLILVAGLEVEVVLIKPFVD
jgi:hypothetical protein